MKKVLLILLSIMMLTGCGGNKNEQTTEPKQLLHISDYFKDKGINNIGTLKCSALNNEKIMYANYALNYFILENGDTYKFVYGGNKIYSNNEQCMKITTNVKVKTFKYKYFLGTDGNYYNITIDNDDIKLEKVELSGYDATLYNDTSVINFTSTTVPDSYTAQRGWYSAYYVLKNDGIHNLIILSSYDNTGTLNYQIVNDEILYKKSDYGNIKRFETTYKEGITLILSDTGLYIKEEVKTEECSKYADIKCETKMINNELYQKYKNDIKYVDSYRIIADDNGFYTTSYLLVK